jgi:hypothetical protein
MSNFTIMNLSLSFEQQPILASATNACGQMKSGKLESRQLLTHI